MISSLVVLYISARSTIDPVDLLLVALLRYYSAFVLLAKDSLHTYDKTLKDWVWLNEKQMMKKDNFLSGTYTYSYIVSALDRYFPFLQCQVQCQGITGKCLLLVLCLLPRLLLLAGNVHKTIYDDALILRASFSPKTIC